MSGIRVILVLGLVAIFGFSAAVDLPVKLEVRRVLDSRSTNIHLSQGGDTVYPFSVTYGACDSSEIVYEKYHDISIVHKQGTDRLIWLLPDGIQSSGCLSAWSSTDELVGRSEPLVINKNSRQWKKKRHLDKGTKLSKRASIPMTSASGIDAGGPWFDGVEALKDAEISAVDAAEAKAKSTSSTSATGGRSEVVLLGLLVLIMWPEIAIVGAGMAGLMTWVGMCFSYWLQTILTSHRAVSEHKRLSKPRNRGSRPTTRRVCIPHYASVNLYTHVHPAQASPNGVSRGWSFRLPVPRNGSHAVSRKHSVRWKQRDNTCKRHEVSIPACRCHEPVERGKHKLHC